ncbi:MAG TPA: MFS transporter [Patescibacteria group bacterium]|nr:MFS transporter [Patescibacteria group bacterium]
MTALAWRRGGLLHVLVALAPAWFAWSGSVAVIGWLAFDASRAPGVVGLTFALRMAPLVLDGVPAGTLSDRIGRVRLLQASNVGAAAIFAAIFAFSASDGTSIAVLLVLSALLGLADAGRLVCGNNLVFEFAGDLGPTRAFAFSSVVGSVGQIAGGAITGALLSSAGPGVAASIVGAAYALSALLFTGFRERAVGPSKTGPSFAAAVREGLALLTRVPAVGLLIAVALVIEMFAFSSTALDPVFAAQVFVAGPVGLGFILAARAVGRLIGSATLAVLHPGLVVGRRLAIAVLAFGLALLVYSRAPTLAIGLPLVVVAGTAGTVVDALVLTAVQASVESTSRGRAAGLWVLMIGFQPLGLIEVGLVAQLAGARFAQGINGFVVAAIGLLLFATVLGRRIREIETTGPAA